MNGALFIIAAFPVIFMLAIGFSAHTGYLRGLRDSADPFGNGGGNLERKITVIGTYSIACTVIALLCPVIVVAAVLS